uniref:TPR_REGION domain-containing protein n=1 Tax=Ascaris lumbricoides TaxID=6252 RepID=A0A0M3IGH1_ASCLU
MRKFFDNLGWICYRRECTADTRHQKICEAEQYLIQSRELEPSCGKTYYYLGRCYGELPERAHDAFTNYRQSIDKSEADADTWCSIGVLYQQQSQPMDALQAFICAVQLDSEHSAAWSDLGRLYEVNGQFSDALHCFKKAIKYRPAAPEALKARIRVLEKELHPSSLLIGNIRSLQPNKLPGLEEAWRLPIPAELSQRQEEFLKLKQQRYRDGSPLLAMSSILRAVSIPFVESVCSLTFFFS